MVLPSNHRSASRASMFSAYFSHNYSSNFIFHKQLYHNKYIFQYKKSACK
nr:MAG TPA: hypothetical protein [Caudoviricetes sp.]